MILLNQEHRNQLDDISAQLMHFEASLRSKEKRIEKTLKTKDQVHHEACLCSRFLRLYNGLFECIL